MKRSTVTRALLAAAALCLAAPAVSQETSLIFATVNPPSAHLTVNILVPWAQRVNEQGKGVVKLDVRDGLTLANLGNAYDRTLSDVVQVAWTIQAAVGGKFRKTEVVTLPFIAPASSEEGSVALWRLYKAGMLDSDYDEIVPLYLCQITHSGVHFSKPPKSLDSLNGYKMIVSSRVLGLSAARLGVTPSSISLNEMYEAIQRGTVDGVMTGWTAFQPFKLAEVTSYHVDTQLGASTGMVFMSKKKWDTLSPAVKKVLEANSGEAQSKAFGAFWDRISEEGRSDVRKTGKHTIVTLSPEQQSKWQATITPVVQEWTKSTPDGDKVLSTYRGLIQKVRSGG
jgi:TRAP-type C4-dicarboxylate transport system substrate-binding protein